MSILKALKIFIFQKNRLKRFVFACKNCFDRHSSLSPLGRYSNCDVDTCVKNYEDNMETARYYASLLGARYLNFLQPFNGQGRSQFSRFDAESVAHMRRRKTFDGNNELDLIIQFYDRLWQRVKDKDFVFDMRDIFERYSEDIYFDQVHCSDIGYDIIAKQIAEEIIKMDKNSSDNIP